MALNFPSSPSVGDVYQRWTWNGVGWAPTVTAAQPMLPIAGGTITGNLGVQGTTTLTGTLTALGQSQINILDVAGQATFADGVEIDGVDAADFATKTYVDDAVASGGLWQGTWDASTNTPDLTQTTLQRNGWGWTVVTPDPTAPFDIPVTPAIPGVSGQTVYNGDHVIWSDAASTFELVSGSSISRQEAEDLFPLKADAIIRGVAGTYNQVAGTPANAFEFNDFQTFLDDNINNRWFSGNVVINVNQTVTTNIAFYNVFFTNGGYYIQVNSDVTICNSLTCQNVAYIRVSTTTSTGKFQGPSAPAMRGYTSRLEVLGDFSADAFGIHHQSTLSLGNATTPTSIGSINLGTATSSLHINHAGAVTIGYLSVVGRLEINSDANVTFTSPPTGPGVIIDNRPGRPLDSFLSRAGGTMGGAITMPGDPSGSFDVATKQYVDNKAIIPQSPSNFPFVTSLGSPIFAGGVWQYNLSIPGWTFASTDLIMIRASNVSIPQFQLNINGLGARPVLLTNYFQGSGWISNASSRLRAQNLGMTTGHTGQGTYGQTSTLPGWAAGSQGYGLDWPGSVPGDYLILRYTGGGAGHFLQLADRLLQAALTKGVGGTLVMGMGNMFGGPLRNASTPLAQEIICWQNQPYSILWLTGAPGQREIYFRTRDISTFSIHNRNIRGQIRKIQGTNMSTGAMTLRISPRSDSWTGMLEAGCGPYNFTSSYRLFAPNRLYGSGTITSAPGAGYLDIPVPQGAQIEIKFKTWEEPGIASTRSHVQTFSASGFPNARTVVFIDDINVYVPA